MLREFNLRAGGCVVRMRALFAVEIQRWAKFRSVEVGAIFKYTASLNLSHKFAWY